MVAGVKKGPIAGLPDDIRDLWKLTVTYARQETIDPLKGLARFVALGLAGSVVLSIGLVLVVLATLRALQTETGSTFKGSWSWAPYLLTLIIAAGAGAGALSMRGRRSPAGSKAKVR